MCDGRSGRPPVPAITTRGKPQTFTHATFPTTAHEVRHFMEQRETSIIWPGQHR